MYSIRCTLPSCHVQKERENEGNEFADKEVFVTTAYKKKLEELRLEEEKEKYEEYLESIGDVTKQKDLGGFYRHLYEQKLGTAKGNVTENQETGGTDVGKSSISSSTKERSMESDVSQMKKQRNYRRRKYSRDNKQSDGEIDDTDDEINRCNLDDIISSKRSKQNVDDNIDADSDFSIDESSEEESSNKENTAKENDDKLTEVTTPDRSLRVNPPAASPEPEKPKIKVDIWKKRCVGEVFDQALRRYYERKAARCS